MSASKCRAKDRLQSIAGGKVVETAKNAARERDRVKDLRNGFASLQSLIPNVPPDTKLSKLDILILATNYIKYLGEILEPKSIIEADDHAHGQQSLPRENRESGANKYLHPVKKWPMRARMYAEKEGVPDSSSSTPGSSSCGKEGVGEKEEMACVSPDSSASVSASPPPCTSNEWESIFDAADLDNGCFLLQLDTSSSSLFDLNECTM